MLPDGQRHLIDKITLEGQTYSLYVLPDSMVDSYFINIVLGPYDAAVPSAIASVPITSIDKTSTPEAALSRAVMVMNAKLQEYFGAHPVPVSWEEKFEAMLVNLKFFLNGDIPQVG